jgi:hypothetical protein
MASQWPPKKNTAFTLSFSLYKNDGTIVANPGTYTKKVSIDGGAVADITASVTEEDTTYGQLSLVIAAGEMNGDWIWIYITDNTAGTVPFTCSFYTVANTQDELGTNLATVDTVVDAIKVKTDYLPSVTAGGDGGVFIAGSNAATSITTALTANITGNLSGSVGTVAANGITATSIAADAINATAVKADAVTKIQTGLATPTNITAGTLTTVTTATNLTNERSKYMHGAVWIGSVANTNTASYVDGIMTNPVSTLAAAKSVADNLGLKKFWIQSGVTITLGAAYVGYVFDGRGFIMALGGQDVSKVQIDRCEGLSGTGTCATGEIVVYDSHLNAISIGEADFVRCHLNGTVTLTQASVPYRFHDCTGITAAKITFSQASQTTVVSQFSGALTIAGMTAATQTLYLDGDGVVTLDNTNSAGTVYISGNIVLVNSGTGQTINQDGRITGTAVADAVWDEVVTTGAHDTATFAGKQLLTASSAGDPWGTALPGAYGAGTAGKLVGDNINAPVADVPTAVENADALLARNVSGGSSTGRTVKQALHFLRNKWSISGTTLTVTDVDDTTPSWTATVGTDAAAVPIVSNDPAT